MDIENVAQIAFEGLSLTESGLARELLVFEHYDIAKGTLFVRRPVIRLENLSALIKEKVNAGVPRRIALWCDTLLVSSGVTISTGDRLFLDVTARSVRVTPDTPGSYIVIDGFKNSIIGIHSAEIPEDFSVGFSVRGEVKATSVLIPAGQYGIATRFDGLTVTQTPREPPEMDLQYENWLDLVNEDGTLREMPFTKDNFPRLLQLQFMMAASQMSINPALAMELLNWICIATSTKISSVLNFQAATMRNSLAAKIQGNVSSVPSVNIYSAKEVLRTRLEAARSFESGFQDLLSEERSSANWGLYGADLLIKSNNAFEEYYFLSELSTNRFNEAQEAQDRAEARFKRGGPREGLARVALSHSFSHY
ncbi:hypothetical protein GGR55DRAFT_702649 [Xylaria sp. FL0064]|nr:hypothetical protein GGR55DRAFT_702649 [Xylaria sp. FL0064]